jgi:hypothetical protein
LEVSKVSISYEENINKILDKISQQEIVDVRDGYLKKGQNETNDQVSCAFIKISSGDTVFSMKAKNGSEKIDVSINLKTKETRKNGITTSLKQEDIDFLLKNLNEASQIMLYRSTNIIKLFQEITKLYEKLNLKEDEIYIVRDPTAAEANKQNETDANGWPNKGTEIRFNLKKREISKNDIKVNDLKKDELKLVISNIGAN